MSVNSKPTWSLRNALTGTSALIGMAAFAAAIVPAGVASAQEQAEEEEIVVTGSRVARRDLVANSPITTVGEQELELSGALSVEGLLNELPQVVAGLSATSNNPGLNGQATVDLRGLGSARTLVLVDGRRLSPSDKSGTVDLNVLPSALIERVEVVTGGASAVYGSDAVAGVVNFITNNDFEGVEIGALGGISGEQDATEYSIDITAGGAFGDGRGHATVFASYFNREELLATERAFSRNATFNSSRTEEGTLENALLNPFPSGGRLNIDAAGNDIDPAAAGYNFSPPNFLVLPADRVTFGAMTTYDFTPDIEGYGQLMYTDSRTAVQLAPAPLAATNRVTVSAANALAQLPGATAQAEILGRPDPNAPITIQRRFTEVGNRFQSFDKDFYQATFGARGSLGDNWDWDAYYSFARSDMYDSLTNDLSSSRLQNALNNCPPGSGAGCTPIDIFGINSITPAQADWLRLTDVVDHHEYQQEVISASITGDVAELPAGPIGVALGVEFREDALNFEPAPASRSDLVGFNFVQPAGGEVDVAEIYGEAIIPLVSNAPFAQYIGLEIGGRVSDYSSVGQTETYKIGGEWQLTDDFRLRGMFNAATRAPSVFELFRAGDQNFPAYGDPCNAIDTNADDIPDTAALDGAAAAINSAGWNFCADWLGLPRVTGPQQTAADAVLSAFGQSDQQVEVFLFGNPNLDPEESETVTLGAVWQHETPFGNFAVTLDYYTIEIADYITSVSANQLLDRCVATLNLASAACVATPRLPSGQLGGLQAPTENSGGIETSGMDLSVGYDLDSFMGGSLNVQALVSYLDEYSFAGGAINGGDYVGVHTGLGGAYPEWKSTLRTTYTYNDWQFSWQWERIGEMDDYGYTALYGYPVVEAVNYHDFTVRWFATENLDFTLICENCTDEDPQNGTASGYAAGLNVDTSIYDGIGRYFRLGIRSRF
jgi:iron complex outermembrane recepter protein